MFTTIVNWLLPMMAECAVGETEAVYECDVCMLPFHEESRRPKVLACGHTFCLPCLMRIHPGRVVCPVDRKEFEVRPSDLPDNFFAIQTLRARFTKKRFWCVDCDSEANANCIDDHIICSLKTMRLKTLHQKSSAIEEQAAKETVQEAIQKLDKIVLDDRVGVYRSFLRGLNINTENAVLEARQSVELSEDAWEAALRALDAQREAASAAGALCREALQMAEGFTVTVESGRVGKWTSEVRSSPGTDHLAFLLLLLRASGDLTRTVEGVGEPDQQTASSNREYEDASGKMMYCQSLCDDPWPPFSAADTLDLSAFHRDFGFEGNERQLQQIIQAKSKVRKVVGLGEYSQVCLKVWRAKKGSDVHYSWHRKNIAYCVDTVLRNSSDTLEELRVQAADLEFDDFRRLSLLPKLRALEVVGSKGCFYDAPMLTTPPGGSALQCVSLDANDPLQLRMLPVGYASLKEVVLRQVALTKRGSAVDNSGILRFLRFCTKLRSLTVVRPFDGCPGGPMCSAQLSPLQASLSAVSPEVVVRCAKCGPVRNIARS